MTAARTFPSRNPATGRVIGEVPDRGEAELDAAIAAARHAVDDTEWSRDPALRRESVRRLHDALVDFAEPMRELITAEAGVPVGLLGVHYAEPVARLLGARPAAEWGVVAVITPATSPLAVALDAIGAVLLAGGAVVLKPAPDASLVAVELARIAAVALPPGVLTVVTTRDVDVAIALTRDPRVDAVRFTGSAVNGERVRVTATAAGKRVVLDLGGTTPVHAAVAADPAAAVADAAASMCAHAGQGCRLPAAVVVPESRYDEMVEVAARTMAGIGLGDPTDPTTICGPVVSPVQRDRVLRYLALAESEGGRFATGGHAVDRDGGWWIAPTVVAGLTPESRLAREEILGPVLVVLPPGMGDGDAAPCCV